MDFERIRNATNDWMKSHSEFQLIMADENESRLQFICSNSALSSFFVVCPTAVKPHWEIETDLDPVRIHLTAAKKCCKNGTATKIEDILECLSKELLSASACGGDVGAGEAGDNENEDDEMEADGDDDYYDEMDEDEPKQEPADSAEKNEMSSVYQQYTSSGSPQGNSLAVNRLIKDLHNLKKSEGKFGFSGQPRGENLFIWDVQLKDIPPESRLGKDLAGYAKQFNRHPYIDMEMVFPGDYPMAPPFVRIIRPRFQFLTGHVTVGGSICMQSLTKSGWSPSNDIESILVQIRATILSDDNASLAPNANHAYTDAEAKDAFKRMVSRYGWNN